VLIKYLIHVHLFQNISVGTLIYTVYAEDKDFGENGRVTYFFKVANSNSQQTDTFIINSETGQIKTQILLDYETKSSYQVHLYYTIINLILLFLITQLS